MGDYYSLREIGGADLAKHYPDKGLLASSNWHNAVLHVEPKETSVLSALSNLSIQSHGFLAVLSANTEGLRVVVALEQFVTFIPWSQATVSAERKLPATVICVETAAVPSLLLFFDLDDAAADDLLRGVIPPLPVRNPPRRLAWWLAEWWVIWIVVGAVVAITLVLCWIALRQ
jgi:hypothetical protein